MSVPYCCEGSPPYECHQIADGPACCQWLRGGGSPQEANQVDTGLKVTLESATNVFNGATDEGDDAVLVSRLLPTERGTVEAGQRLTVIRWTLSSEGNGGMTRTILPPKQQLETVGDVGGGGKATRRGPTWR